MEYEKIKIETQQYTCFFITNGYLKRENAVKCEKMHYVRQRIHAADEHHFVHPSHKNTTKTHLIKPMINSAYSPILLHPHRFIVQQWHFALNKHLTKSHSAYLGKRAMRHKKMLFNAFSSFSSLLILVFIYKQMLCKISLSTLSSSSYALFIHILSSQLIAHRLCIQHC